MLLTVGLLGSFINYRGVVLFLYRQLVFGASSAPDWYRYFDAYLSGRANIVAYLVREWAVLDGIELALHGLAALNNMILGAAGLYFLTPVRIGGTVFLAAYGLIGLLLIFALFRLLYFSKITLLEIGGRPKLYFMGAVLSFSALVVGLLILKSQYWSAGKALAFCITVRSPCSLTASIGPQG